MRLYRVCSLSRFLLLISGNGGKITVNSPHQLTHGFLVSSSTVRDQCDIVIVLPSEGPHVTEKGGTTDPATGAIECQPEWLLHTSALLYIVSPGLKTGQVQGHGLL